MTTRQTTVKLGSNDSENFWVLLDRNGKALLSRGGFDSPGAAKTDCKQCAYLLGGNLVFEDLTDEPEPEPEVSTTATPELDPPAAVNPAPPAALEPFDDDTGEVLSTTATPEPEPPKPKPKPKKPRKKKKKKDEES